MAKTVLVFDFGASSARAMLCGFDGSSITLKEIHRFENNLIMENDKLCWDFEYLFSEVKNALSLAVFNGGFDAISIDSWGVDYGLINRGGELMSSPVHYRDKRTALVFEAMKEVVSFDELYSRTGIYPNRINTVFQLYFQTVYEKNTMFSADKMLMIPDLLAYYLTGEMKTEFTNATTTQLVNTVSRDWDYELIDKLGIPKRIFCPIIQPGEEYGLLCPSLAAELKIEQVPVIAAPSHDTASAIVSVPSVTKDFVFLSSGTWTLFGTELDRPIANDEAFALGLSNEGGFDRKTELLKNIMGLWLIQESRRQWLKDGQKYSFAELEELAAVVEPFKCVINPNHDSFSTPGNIPEKIKSFCIKTGQPCPENAGEVVRCIYESLALEYLRTFRDIRKLTGKDYERVYIIGGGARDSMLCQLTASALGAEVVAGPVEATSLGNAISALISLGEIPGTEQGRRIIANSDLVRRYSPTDTRSFLEKLPDYLAICRR